jgi:cytoskeletal protein RodZ
VDDLSELADVLRKARQEKGMSLVDIQEATKIQRRYLEAIESGNFAVLPGHFYVRAFIKSYAEAVGLDAEELMNQYKSELPEPPKVEEAPPPLRQNRHNRKERSGDGSKWVSRVLLYLFALFVFGVIIAGINYALKGNNENTAPPAAPKTEVPPEKKAEIVVPPPETPDVKQPVQTPVQQPPAATGKLTAAPKTGSVMNYELTGADKIIVKVTAKSGDHWVSVSGVNGQIGQKTIKEGESQTFEVTEENEALVRVVRARDVEVLVNGQPVDTSEAKKSGTQRIKITRK